jgi:hypothetical protein
MHVHSKLNKKERKGEKRREKGCKNDVFLGQGLNLRGL